MQTPLPNVSNSSQRKSTFAQFKMYEPLALLRSMAELQRKFQPEGLMVGQGIQYYDDRPDDTVDDRPHDGEGKQPAFLAEENQAKVIEYKGERVASFTIKGQQMICLPQVYDLFLKSMVGGLHTVYTKLKRLEITPVVCNVEQVRALRSLGAIQPGVNRCKLIARDDFDQLLDDCTTTCNRPGRPTKRLIDDWQSSIGTKHPRTLSELSATSPSTSSFPSVSTPSYLSQAQMQLLSSLGGGNHALLGHLLPGFNQLLVQQMLANSSIGHNDDEAEREEEIENDETSGDCSGDSADKPEGATQQRGDSCESPEDQSERSNKSSSGSGDGTEQKAKDEPSDKVTFQLRAQDDDSRGNSSSRDDSKSVSPTNNASSTLQGSPSGGSIQSRNSSNNKPELDKLVGLLETTLEQFKQRDDLLEERKRREHAEKELTSERRRRRLFQHRWMRTKRELTVAEKRILVLEARTAQDGQTS